MTSEVHTIDPDTLTPAERAERIAKLTSEALKAATTMQRDLAEVVMLARHDYRGNAAGLEAISGAYRIANAALAEEFSRWEGYASARKGSEAKDYYSGPLPHLG